MRDAAISRPRTGWEVAGMTSSRFVSLPWTSAVALAATLAACMVVADGSATASSSPDAGSSGTSRVSVRSNGAQAHGRQDDPSISATGRYVAFTSAARDLVTGDTNGAWDVFVRDRVAKVTRRLSVGHGGTQANGSSYEPAISADGRFVAFTSLASNLVAGDTNGVHDVFVRDRVAKVTRRVSVSTGGSQANGATLTPAISADGRYVAFESLSTNLVPRDDNRNTDVFVRDRWAKVTRKVSIGPGDTQLFTSSRQAAISADGRYVTFSSDAAWAASDTNETYDVYVRDRQAHVTKLVSGGLGGALQGQAWSAGPAISADGRYVTFESAASNLVVNDTNGAWDVFVYDMVANTTERVSVTTSGGEANDDSYQTVISGGGRYIAFTSAASNLGNQDTNDESDVFVRDTATNVTKRVSISDRGNEANSWSVEAAISARGRFVAFTSYASNLVAGDTNGNRDVFVRDRGRG